MLFNVRCSFVIFFVSLFPFIFTPSAFGKESYIYDKAHQPLSAKLQRKMADSQMSAHSPILIRIYKEERVMEIWKERSDKQFAYLISYPICRWSGLLGPKYLQGDLQSPEGFYTISSWQLNPNSRYYLSVNIGYPNRYDRAHGRRGSAVMIHGGCHSVGCYAMTDKYMAEIYALVREALAGGQKAIQVQAFPFRMNEGNMARYRRDKNYPFWQNLKEGADIFESTHRPPLVWVKNKRYYFRVDPLAKNITNSERGLYSKLGDYGQKIHDYLHQLRPPQKTLQDLFEAQKISQWTHRLIHGLPVASLKPPYES